MTSLPLPLPESESPPLSAPEIDYNTVLDRLAGSAFRRRKALLGTELEYLRARGLDDVLKHARRFVQERLAPALPDEDGRQTPYRGHPAFIAQHATATCCRGCLEIWHSIPKGRALGDADVGYIVELIAAWLRREARLPAPLVRPALPADTRAARRAAAKRRTHNLRLVTDETAAEGEPANTMVLEEREEDGNIVRRWLQLELFNG
jgi:hypothetical protein